MAQKARRIVVTGLGALTPIGNNVSETWDSLIHGNSGISQITQFDPSGLETRIAGEVKGFDPKIYFNARDARRLDRVVQLALVAAHQAVDDAGPGLFPADRGRIAIAIGTGIGGGGTLYRGFLDFVQSGSRAVSPFFIPMSIPDSIAARLASEFDARAINLTFPAACASGTIALGEAAELIRRGSADVVLAGGAEAGIVPPVLAGFGQMRVLSTHNENPAGASRPFDKDRDGFVLSEGAAILILESYEHAAQRGAKIYGELAGYGASMDAANVAAPSEGGLEMARAILQSLQQAGVTAAGVDYLNAHGTGTLLNDRIETQAIKKAFGSSTGRLMISSTKSMTGHMMGAAGAVEALISLMVIKQGCIPPTINYEHADPDCDLDYTPNIAKEAAVDIAMSTSLGMGGHNASLVFRRI
jgi:3-oxoacyl-[acyl-carrier-protein] synthase II